MEIVIERVNGVKYMGKLYIDGDLIDTALDNRPGCVIRTLLNRMQEKYGKPDDTITVNIDGW